MVGTTLVGKQGLQYDVFSGLQLFGATKDNMYVLCISSYGLVTLQAPRQPIVQQLVLHSTHFTQDLTSLL